MLLKYARQKFGLQFKATLENVTNVRPLGDDFRWFLKVHSQPISLALLLLLLLLTLQFAKDTTTVYCVLLGHLTTVT